MGFVTIRDEIRTSAAETIGYFNEQGVTLNVISGRRARVTGVRRPRAWWAWPGADA